MSKKKNAKKHGFEASSEIANDQLGENAGIDPDVSPKKAKKDNGNYKKK